MKIALDIDGVLASTDKIMREFINEEFKLTDDLLHPGETYNNVYRLDNEEIHTRVNDRVRELFNTDPLIYRYASVIEGSVRGSHIVKPVAYITRRPDDYKIGETTRIWLKEHGFYEAPVYLIPKGTCKSTKAKELGVDILVEDSPHEITSCRENGLKTLVMRYPYNEYIIDPDTEVVSDWNGILDWYDRNK